MRQILPLKYLCEDVIAHLDKPFKTYKIKSNTFEKYIGCIYTTNPNNISPSTNHIATNIFLRYHIYYKDTDTNGDIILEKWYQSSPRRYNK